MQNHMHLFDLSPLCAFKCLLKSPAWIHVGCIWFFSTMCFQMCPHCENILTYRGHGRRSWRTIKSPFTLYKQIPKNPGILFSKIPGLWSTENPGIPLGPDQDRPGQIRANPPDITIGIARPANLTNLDDLHGITIGIGQFRNSCNVTIDNLHCLGGRTCWYIPVIGPLLP